MKGVGVLIALVVAGFLVVAANLAAETPRFTAWCADQGGTTPNGWFSDPICVRDGLYLIPPKNADARWPS